MTRPGFLVPNANLVAPDLQASQPDQGDFLVLGNSQYGVVTGCKAVLSFPTVTLATDAVLSTAHILICGGEPFLLQGTSSITLAGQGASGRWDLVVFDSEHGGFRAITGTPADNPVFPDITATMVLLAAVSVPAVGGGATPTLIDKRNFLSTTLVADSDSDSILRTYDTDPITPSIRVNITGEGRFTWGTQTRLEETGPGVLTLNDELQAKIFTAANSMTVAGFDVITTATINWGSGLPGTADTGDIFVDITTGDVRVWRGDHWEAIAASTPTGSVIMSFASATSMVGWLPLLGQTVPVDHAGGLPSLHPSWVTSGSITLPDMRGRFPLGGGTIGSGSPGFVNGTNPHGEVVDDRGTISTTIEIDQMPAHVHRTGTNTDAGGSHQHLIPAWAPYQPLGNLPSNTGSANTNTQTVDTTTYTRFAGHHLHELPAHLSVGGSQPLHMTPPTFSIYFYIKT